MLLMILYVVTILVLTVMVIVQVHTCDDLLWTHDGEYDVLMCEIMELKNTCSYDLNDHPNGHLLERGGLPD